MRLTSKPLLRLSVSQTEIHYSRTTVRCTGGYLMAERLESRDKVEIPRNPQMPFQLVRDEDTGFEFAAFVPDDFKPTGETPIIVFLHGSGERGYDPGLPLKGNAHVFDHLQLPAAIIFPQCDFEHRAFYGEMETRVFSCIGAARKIFGLSSDKVLLVGYSMGGSSNLWLGAKHPNQIDGIVCIAPGITWMGEEAPPRLPAEDEELFYSMFVATDRTKSIAEHVRNIPIWFLQGTEDEPCPIEETRSLVSDLHDLGAKPIVTEYDGVDHATLTMALEQEGVFQWLLSL